MVEAFSFYRLPEYFYFVLALRLLFVPPNGVGRPFSDGGGGVGRPCSGSDIILAFALPFALVVFIVPVLFTAFELTSMAVLALFAALLAELFAAWSPQAVTVTETATARVDNSKVVFIKVSSVESIDAHLRENRTTAASISSCVSSSKFGE